MEQSQKLRRKEDRSVSRRMERLAERITRLAGTSAAFATAVLLVLVWGATGPIFHYSATWQLVINTGTTIITFLMVFLIQRTQNKDSLAVQLKLNEIVAAIEGASNRLIDVESLSEAELRALAAHYAKLSQMADDDEDVTRSHSVEEAEARHSRKQKQRRIADSAKELSDRGEKR